MSNQYREVLSLPVKAAVDLTANRFVTAAGALPSAGGNALGVALNSALTGQRCTVINLGTAAVEASAAIAAGALIESLVDGRAVTKSSGVGVARALEAATAAGQLIEVALIPN